MHVCPAARVLGHPLLVQSVECVCVQALLQTLCLRHGHVVRRLPRRLRHDRFNRIWLVADARWLAFDDAELIARIWAKRFFDVHACGGVRAACEKKSWTGQTTLRSSECAVEVPHVIEQIGASLSPRTERVLPFRAVLALNMLVKWPVEESLVRNVLIAV